MRNITTAGFLIGTIAFVLSCSSDPPGTGDVEDLSPFLPTATGFNVLVISFDALRPDLLGTYGYKRGTSPNIDGFAERSLVFEDAISAAQATPSSFAAVFTGQLPQRVFLGWQLTEGQTLAKVFSAAGYATSFFSNNSQLLTKRNFNQGFDSYEILRKKDSPDKEGVGLADDETVLQRAISQLENRSQQPFLIWVHFLSPHSPYTYRDVARHLYADDYAGRFEKSTGSQFRVNSGAELRRIRDLYAGEVFYADLLFGRLMGTIDRLGVSDRTIIVLMSDHGEEFLEHGRTQHQGVYQEVIRIPLMIHHPRAVSGHRTTVPTSNVDLLPTLASLAGLEVQRPFDGVPLTSPVDPDRMRVAVAMTNDHDNYLAALKGTNKIVFACQTGVHELFDLAYDSDEAFNLVAERTDVYSNLFEELSEIVGDEPCRVIQQATRGVFPDYGLDEQTVQQIEALGYLDVRGAENAPTQEGTNSPSVRFWADPNPVPVDYWAELGVTTLNWAAPDSITSVEIRVASPSGKLMYRGGSTGSAQTGAWVRHRMSFYLVNAESGQVLATTTVRLGRQ